VKATASAPGRLRPGVGLLLDRRVVRRLSVVATAGAVAFLMNASASRPSVTATLEFRATLATSSPAGPCPSGAPQDAECHARTAVARVRGLGNITSSYTWFFAHGDCPALQVKPFATTGRLVVAQKGEIDFALADGARCVEQEPVRNEPQQFTITGGTGIYQGASGQGTAVRSLSGGRGVELWTGTLTVSGLEFDTTPPRIVGAVSKTVRAPAGAKRARVTYKVTARDAVDGLVAAACAPRSGSLFKRGRTAVTCTATDESANATSARFVVTVR
jgi:HYR domain